MGVGAQNIQANNQGDLRKTRHVKCKANSSKKQKNFFVIFICFTPFSQL